MIFGRTTPDAVRHSYGDVVKSGVRLLRETITAIDPENRTVATDATGPRLAGSAFGSAGDLERAGGRGQQGFIARGH